MRAMSHFANPGEESKGLEIGEKVVLVVEYVPVRDRNTIGH